ncbi:MogA/MoaB family molybdenum cofactor biosynthesis protein [Crocosphaera sp. XPORK-15E]|uniref:MogA/MoaB family molybdenum cofactor biosynthesis protein n=1 Tax=Crocosphaera sp. XPORK-15E TaxID=3110247 RepID=UPI002B220AB0|nr:MogA/MoaB family molybdenum cofactor biosynthesis protein [Crocosphaera sp. XPORK-15E]MEA5533117.1 MogA/MoaB family molybdenum cofactor biosynthesis protein [Crocosphaera sp. XPORK-15E]
MSTPHPDQETIIIRCGIITVSDTRTPESDRSGQLIQQRLTDAGHQITHYCLLKDEPEAIKAQIKQLTQHSELDVIIINGGTGIAPRDTTYDALAGLLEKTLPGFGELFRYLSYQEIGSRAMASRAIAGVYQNTLIFSLPGSSNAVKLALDQLILPELIHLTQQLQGR